MRITFTLISNHKFNMPMDVYFLILQYMGHSFEWSISLKLSCLTFHGFPRPGILTLSSCNLSSIELQVNQGSGVDLPPLGQCDSFRSEFNSIVLLHDYFDNLRLVQTNWVYRWLNRFHQKNCKLDLISATYNFKEFENIKRILLTIYKCPRFVLTMQNYVLSVQISAFCAYITAFCPKKTLIKTIEVK